uniref:Uncharacterized protein n=1 Tax=Siphoviridae sp. ct7es18 TaxID=2826166 RepID=A0A8S5MH79_9CAUD|nr:MAG TPA: hypothetical protein [Siphoviridae sp. ct7es18]
MSFNHAGQCRATPKTRDTTSAQKGVSCFFICYFLQFVIYYNCPPKGGRGFRPGGLRF